MDDTLLFIPPCCVDKKLPRAIMEAPRRALTFYTHGDVSMEKFYRAVSYLVADAHVMVLAMPNLTHQTMAFLRQCFEREWITDLVLSTFRDVSSLIDSTLAGYRQHIIYACDKDVSDMSSHLVLYSSQQALTINGPMWEIGSTSPLCSYTMLFHSHFDTAAVGDFSNPLLNILLPDILRHRKSLKKVSSLSNLSPLLNRFINSKLPPYRNS